MSISVSPKIKLLKLLYKTGKYLDMSDRLLETWDRARGGSDVVRGLGLISTAKIIASAIFSFEDPYETLTSNGFSSIDYEFEVQRFLCTTLLSAPHQILSDKKVSADHIYIWDEKVAAIWNDRDRYWDDIQCLDGNESYITDLVDKYLWPKNKAISIVSSGSKGNRPAFSLRPLAPANDYIGSPSPHDLAKRLSVKKGCRFILLVGATGSGKTTLARKTVEELVPNGKLLKLTPSFLRSRPVSEVVDIAKIFRPDILLIDDIHTIIKQEEIMLALMEALQSEDSIIVGTFMKDDLQSYSISELSPGDLYFPGMRPGRVDEIVLIPKPDDKSRYTILSHYLGFEPTQEMVGETAGFTGAYLKEFAFRVREFGVDNWQNELCSLRVFLPKNLVDETLPDEEGDDIF